MGDKSGRDLSPSFSPLKEHLFIVFVAYFPNKRKKKNYIIIKFDDYRCSDAVSSFHSTI